METRHDYFPHFAQPLIYQNRSHHVDVVDSAVALIGKLTTTVDPVYKTVRLGRQGAQSLTKNAGSNIVV